MGPNLYAKTWTPMNPRYAGARPAYVIRPRLPANRRIMTTRGGYRLIQPGTVRTVGAYRRANPKNKGVEKKWLDLATNSTADLTGGIFGSFTGIAQNTTDNGRIGNKICIKNLNGKVIVYQDDMTTTSYGQGIMRVIIFIDKQANGAVPLVTDILETANWLSFRNMDQVDRFVILKDKVCPASLITSNTTHTSTGAKFFKFQKKFFNLDIHYSSTTGAITEVRSNNLGVLFITNNTNVNLEGSWRAKFTDM